MVKHIGVLKQQTETIQLTLDFSMHEIFANSRFTKYLVFVNSGIFAKSFWKMNNVQKSTVTWTLERESNKCI